MDQDCLGGSEVTDVYFSVHKPRKKGQRSNIKITAQDPFNFDADPDPGSALEKMDPDTNPGHLLNFLTKNND